MLKRQQMSEKQTMKNFGTTTILSEKEFEILCNYYHNKKEALKPFFQNKKPLIKNYIYKNTPIKI